MIEAYYKRNLKNNTEWVTYLTYATEPDHFKDKDGEASFLTAIKFRF